MSPFEVAAARLRIEEAKSALDDARAMANEERWRSCSNRMYYACFYAALAILALDGKGSSKHTAVRSLFLKDYVNQGLFPRSIGRFYADVLDARINADYALEKPLPVEKISEWLVAASEFIKVVEDHVNTREADQQGTIP